MTGAASLVNSLDLRRACGRFATGVAVVTARDENAVVGMTINSFASVSLDPPLVLWSLRNDARSRRVFENARLFAISILSAEQERLARIFASSDPKVFDGANTFASPDGLPLISGAIAHLECSTYEVRNGGDHRIVIGSVDRAATHEGAPLLFYDGRLYSDIAGLAEQARG